MKGSVSASVRFLTLSLTASAVLGGTYQRSEHIVGNGFYTSFDFQAIGDPTNGRVTYVNEATARSQNLTFASDNTFIMRADARTVLSASGPGRNSVRLRSKNVYTTHVAVFDMSHMPQGCGTWPAVWETNEQNWPSGGETDIVEGVNDQGNNQVTLHTLGGCTMPFSRAQTGTSLQLDCDYTVNGNTGCGVNVGQAASYGPTFNGGGGGWYALERTGTFISVWFWPRNSGSVPEDVRAGGTSVNTAAWGTPVAHFPNTSCDFNRFFNANNIIINLTFCGDWAGQQGIFVGAGCPGTCNDFVNNNPAAFTNAYFQFNAVNVYL
ncbi:glycoside hydrolase family 16 protein [Mycena rebaudengoi]|nr:glycoside hydrolase family 16 protein [Mycena rebaudengoi]